MLKKALLFFLIFSLLLTSCNVLVTKPLNSMIEDVLPNNSGSESDQVPVINKNTPDAPRNAKNRIGLAYSKVGDSYEAVSASKDIASTGVGWVRVEFDMADCISSQGEFDPNCRALETVVNSAVENGLSIIGLLDYGPGGIGLTNERILDIWRNYLRSVVNRFGPSIHVWEIQNEPNLINSWQKIQPGAKTIDLSFYVQELKIAYNIIKGIDPNDEVVLGGLSSDLSANIPPLDFMKSVASLGGGKYLDGIALHLYSGVNLPEEGIEYPWNGGREKLNLAEYGGRVIDEAKALFGRQIPLWITETGYASSQLDEHARNGIISRDQIQGALMGRLIAELLSFPEVKAITWFLYKEQGGAEGFALEESGRQMLKTLAGTIANAEWRGVSNVLDANRVTTNNAWDLRFQAPDGRQFSVFWLQPYADGNYAAYYEGDLQGTAKLINPFTPIMDTSVRVEEEFTINNFPTFATGAFNDKVTLVMDNIKKAQAEPEPGPQGSDFGHPLVYVKNGELWLYSPETQQKFAILSGDGQYDFSNPRVSPNGRYVAVERHSEHAFILLDLQTNSQTSISITSPTDMLGDTLMGWDAQNRLYFTRTIGSCQILTQNELEGPDAMEVHRYDPATQREEKVYNLPNDEEHPHGYSVGVGISASGRYASYLRVACNIGGWFSTYIYDSETNKIFNGAYGLTSISNNEQLIAKNSDRNYDYRKYVAPVIESVDGELLRELRPFAASEIIWEEPRFSFDDHYVAFNSWSLSDEEGDPYNSYDGKSKMLGEMLIMPVQAELPMILGVESPGAPQMFAAWSPVDNRIAYYVPDENWTGKLYIYDLDTGETTFVDEGVSSAGIQQAAVDW